MTEQIPSPTAPSSPELPPERFAEMALRIEAEVGRFIVGQQQLVRQTLISLIAGSHALLEGVPGLGKTMLVRTMADALDLGFSRIQFTPDLMPADIIGTNIIVEEGGERRFRFQQGPIFGNLILADEINRATPKTQSALLEAMQEHRVTVAKQQYTLSEPFFVLATQNPLEMEGTYPLPEAQLDRFMLKVLVDYPEYSDELTVVDRAMQPPPPPSQVLDPQVLKGAQELVRTVYVDRRLRDYAVKLASATRRPKDFNLDEIEPYIQYGASPRAPINLILAARALAVQRGRDYLLPSDVEWLAPDVLRHRIVPSYRALAEGISVDHILARVAEKLPVPGVQTLTYNRPTWAIIPGRGPVEPPTAGED